jgi:hypothetical protein
VKQLFSVRRLLHDSQRVLAAIHQVASVPIELFLDTDLSFREIIEFARVCRELCVASFADTENRNVLGSFYDPEFALWHVQILAHREGWA